HSRRSLLKALALAAAGGLGPAALLAPVVPAPPPTPPPVPTPVPLSTPLAPVPTTTEDRQFFVPLADYHELPPECYAQNLIQPLEIIVHWDGNQHGRPNWLAPITFDTLRFTQ